MQYLIDSAGETVLLRELNHRVQNTLQVLGSSLRQLARIRTDERSFLRDAAALDDKLAALGTLHRKLSEPPADGELLDDLCRAVVGHLLEAFARQDVRATIEMSRSYLTPAKKFRLLLLVVELVTNALKHGSQDSGSSILVALVDRGASSFELIVSSDFGPAPLSAGTPPRMAAELARSLGGDLNLAVEAGYAVTVEFGSEPGPVQAMLRADPPEREQDHARRQHQTV